MKLESTKEKILSVAEKIFSRFGYHKTTVDDIANSACKAKGSVYYYFRNKEELYQGVLEKEVSFLKKELQKVINKEYADVSKNLKVYISKRMKLLESAFNYCYALSDKYISNYDFIADIRGRFEKFEINSMRKILEKGVKRKQFCKINIDETARAFVTSLQSVDTTIYANKRFKEMQISFERMLNIIIHGIQPSIS